MSLWTKTRDGMFGSGGKIGGTLLGMPGLDLTNPKSYAMPFYEDDPIGLYGRFKANGNTGGDKYASNTYAKLIREQYNDWLERYYPYIQKQMDLSDHRLMNTQLGKVGTLAQHAQSGAETGVSNQLARYGVSPVGASNPQFKDNSRSLNNALAIAGAKNGIREAEQDRQLNILTGASSPLRQQLNVVNPGTA